MCFPCFLLCINTEVSMRCWHGSRSGLCTRGAYCGRNAIGQVCTDGILILTNLKLTFHMHAEPFQAVTLGPFLKPWMPSVDFLLEARQLKKIRPTIHCAVLLLVLIIAGGSYPDYPPPTHTFPLIHKLTFACHYDQMQ